MINCLNCNLIITSEYAKKFCGSSCSASYNLKGKHRNKFWCIETFGKYEQKIPTPEINKYSPLSKIAWGPYSKIKINTCSNCDKLFTSKKITTTCSDVCFISIKKKNATGIKRKYYKNMQFDSNWEIEMAILLDKNNIIWEQPKIAVLWKDNMGKERKYFPDFFLPDYNIFLDPKNPIVISKQKEKLDAVEKIIKLLYGNPNDILARLIGFEPTSSFPVT